MAVPDRVSSIIKPRYLTFVFDSIRFPSQITFNFSQLLNFLFVPNNIDSVFPSSTDIQKGKQVQSRNYTPVSL